MGITILEIQQYLLMVIMVEFSILTSMTLNMDIKYNIAIAIYYLLTLIKPQMFCQLIYFACFFE